MTHSTSADTSLAKGNLMAWPDISAIGKYNPPLGHMYSGTIIQFPIYVDALRIYVAIRAHVPIRIDLLLYQGVCAIAKGQEASGSLAMTEFLAGVLTPYFLPRPGFQHFFFSSSRPLWVPGLLSDQA